MKDMVWNPRFLVYCNGVDPEAVLRRDGTIYPGGKMTGFLLWSAAILKEFERVRPTAFLHGSLVDQAAYDAWLGAGAEKK